MPWSRRCAVTDHRPARATSLRALLEVEGVDALLVTHLPNIRWLTGFSGSAALLVVSAKRLTLITDFRYATQAPSEAGGAAEVLVDRRSVWDRLGRVLASEAPETLATEGGVITARDAARISALAPGRVVPLTDLV